MASPIIYRWSGEAMEPLARFHNEVNAHFVIGATYELEEVLERSSASHRHYFAVIREAWLNLPERLAERFPDPDHLRKFALIKAGFRDERSIVCSSKAEAQRLAAFVRPMDDYAVVTSSEAVVTVYTAKSQSSKAMGREGFQASKEAVLGVLAEMIGADPTALSRRAKEAA